LSSAKAVRIKEQWPAHPFGDSVVAGTGAAMTTAARGRAAQAALMSILVPIADPKVCGRFFEWATWDTWKVLLARCSGSR